MTLIIFFAPQSKAAETLHLSLGLGAGFGPGSLRVGGDRFELLLPSIGTNGGIIGLGILYKKKEFYTTIGPIYAISSNNENRTGMQSGVGVMRDLVKGVRWFAEVNGQFWGGDSQGQGYVGVTLYQ